MSLVWLKKLCTQEVGTGLCNYRVKSYDWCVSKRKDVLWQLFAFTAFVHEYLDVLPITFEK